MSTSQKATMLAKPVLYKDITSDPPWFPIPIQARLTFSPAFTGAVPGNVPAEVFVQIVGSAVAAESKSAFFKNDRREFSFEFIRFKFNYCIKIDFQNVLGTPPVMMWVFSFAINFVVKIVVLRNAPKKFVSNLSFYTTKIIKQRNISDSDCIKRISIVIAH